MSCWPYGNFRWWVTKSLVIAFVETLSDMASSVPDSSLFTRGRIIGYVLVAILLLKTLIDFVMWRPLQVMKVCTKVMEMVNLI